MAGGPVGGGFDQNIPLIYILLSSSLFSLRSLYYLPLLPPSTFKKKIEEKKERRKRREAEDRAKNAQQPILNRTSIKSPAPPTRFVVWAGVEKSGGPGGGPVDGPSTSHPKKSRDRRTRRRAHTRRQRPAKLIKLAAPLPAPISLCTHSIVFWGCLEACFLVCFSRVSAIFFWRAFTARDLGHWLS